MGETDWGEKESWALKNWCFWMWCWRRLLRVPLDCKEVQLVHPKGDQSWCSLEGLMLKLKNSSTLATLYEELTPWKRPWYWEGLGAGGEGDDRGWDGWMASLTRWMWVWVNSGSWWWTGRPSVLQFMGSQRVRHDWVTEVNWTEFHRYRNNHRENASSPFTLNIWTVWVPVIL